MKMAKYGFYGVYGFNGAGIYDNWSEVMRSKPYIKGFKNKKFKRREVAVEYILKGLIEEYGVVGKSEIQVETFYQKTNWFWRLDDKNPCLTQK